MAAPVTQKYEQLVLELETSTPGVYAVICGIMGFTMDRSADVGSSQVPADCTDESLPYATIKAVKALDFKVSGSGKWAQQSHGTMQTWFYGGTEKNIRVRHVNAASGDTEYESGPALLAKLSNERIKGEVVTADLEIEFSGIPTRTAKA